LVAGAARLVQGPAGNAIGLAAADGSCTRAHAAGATGLIQPATSRTSVGSRAGRRRGVASADARPVTGLGRVRRRSAGVFVGCRDVSRNSAQPARAQVSVGTGLWAAGAGLGPARRMRIVFARLGNHEAKRQQEARVSLRDCHQKTPMAETPAVPRPKTGPRLRLAGGVRAARRPK